MADFSGLDAGGTLLFAQESLRRRREAELNDLELALRWADLHAEDPKSWPEERQFPGMCRLIRIGGSGTPRVQDLPIAEFAISRQAHTMATRWAMADALDLRHRLPKCFDALRTGRAEVWLARRIARATRDLSVEEAAQVDAAMAPVLLGEQPSRVLEILEAKVIEANPQAHADRISAERARRFVAVGKADEAGLRHVIARVEHGDAVWVDALLDRVADILIAQDEAAGRVVLGKEAMRSVAFGWLARPAELLELLLANVGQRTGERGADDGERGVDDGERGVDNGERDGERGEGQRGGDSEDVDRCDDAGQDKAGQDDAGQDDAGQDDAGQDDAGQDDAGQDDAGQDVDARGPLRGVSERLLELLRSKDLTRLRPRAVVYVHLHAAALEGHGSGVARVEAGGGPRLFQHLARMLAHSNVAVKPVIDLNEQVSLDAYETPQWLRERIHLIRPGDAFPHSTTISRAVDIDHPEPYRHDPGAPAPDSAQAPPGQSGTHNSAPLTRFHHRAKTHAGFRLRQPGPGTYVWRTPHHLYRLVDQSGTHPIDETLAHALTEGTAAEQRFAQVVATTPKRVDQDDRHDDHHHYADRPGRASGRVQVIERPDILFSYEAA